MIYKKEASSQERHHVTQTISLNLEGEVRQDIGLVAGRFGSSLVFFTLTVGDKRRPKSISLCMHAQGSSKVENFSIPPEDHMFKRFKSQQDDW